MSPIVEAGDGLVEPHGDAEARAGRLPRVATASTGSAIGGVRLGGEGRHSRSRRRRGPARPALSVTCSARQGEVDRAVGGTVAAFIRDDRDGVRGGRAGHALDGPAGRGSAHRRSRRGPGPSRAREDQAELQGVRARRVGHHRLSDRTLGGVCRPPAPSSRRSCSPRPGGAAGRCCRTSRPGRPSRSRFGGRRCCSGTSSCRRTGLTYVEAPFGIEAVPLGLPGEQVHEGRPRGRRGHDTREVAEQDDAHVASL